MSWTLLSRTSVIIEGEQSLATVKSIRLDAGERHGISLGKPAHTKLHQDLGGSSIRSVSLFAATHILKCSGSCHSSYLYSFSISPVKIKSCPTSIYCERMILYPVSCGRSDILLCRSTNLSDYTKYTEDRFCYTLATVNNLTPIAILFGAGEIPRREGSL